MNNSLFNKLNLIQSLFKSVEREWHLEYSNILKATNAVVSPNQG